MSGGAPILPEATILDPDRDIGVLVAARCRWQSTSPENLEFTVTLDGDECAQIAISIVTQR
jgi:hypothetical protein